MPGTAGSGETTGGRSCRGETGRPTHQAESPAAQGGPVSLVSFKTFNKHMITERLRGEFRSESEQGLQSPGFARVY